MLKRRRLQSSMSGGWCSCLHDLPPASPDASVFWKRLTVVLLCPEESRIEVDRRCPRNDLNVTSEPTVEDSLDVHDSNDQSKNIHAATRSSLSQLLCSVPGKSRAWQHPAGFGDLQSEEANIPTSTCEFTVRNHDEERTNHS